MARRKSMPRLLPANASSVSSRTLRSSRFDAPRRIRDTVMDFSSLRLPADVRLAFAEAFWQHFGVLAERALYLHWWNVKTFARFAHESAAVLSLADLNGDLLVRYVEWLNGQRRSNGQPWSKSSRSRTYATLRTLLQWLERCRPEILGGIDYPFNPFPWRNRDARPVATMSARALRALLKACKSDIKEIRARRTAADAERASAAGSVSTLGGLLNYIDQRFGGVVPPDRQFSVAGQYAARQALTRFGGMKGVEPCLYPRLEALLPYYLAILIHAAGNPEPIAEIECDCLQPVPLLHDREALVWFKSRSNRMQRRTFSATDRFEPPSLVKEILEWNQRLRPMASADHRDRLFLYKHSRGVSVLTTAAVRHHLKGFRERHELSHFSLASIRPSVLASFYRVSGDLRKTQSLANHAHLATTIGYVDTPLVKAQNDARIAALQGAFIEHIEQCDDTAVVESPHALPAEPPGGAVMSMFGFDCSNPFEGIAPGSRRGELCTNFMGCLTCPNAIIAQDPTTLARLLQARDHLRASATTLHPARWKAFYQPQLQILEQDILPRFGSDQHASAQALMRALPPLPELR